MSNDEQVDIVVVGFGAAGAAAAITAHDLGANVAILEKAQSGGGSTEASGGNIRLIRDIPGAIRHFLTLADQGTPEDMVSAIVHGLTGLPDWLASLGATFRDSREPPALGMPGADWAFKESAFPGVEDSEAIGGRLQLASKPGSTGGEALWQFLKACVEARNVDVRYNTVPELLLRDTETGRVSGIELQDGASKKNLYARSGVVLACGGFNWAPDLHIDLFGTPLPALTPPHRNAGDGIRLAQGVGAQLWHMSSIAARFGYKFPDYEAAFKSTPPSNGYFYVDQLGRRYVDETGIIFHAAGRLMLDREPYTGKLTRCPSFMVFDETTRLSGPIGPQPNGHNRFYDWSADNSVEVERGWISRADTLAELGSLIGVPSQELEHTTARYNAARTSGADELRRDTRKMDPVDRPPYYAVPIWPCLLNTQGGPKRNARAEVVDPRGDPIPGLYSAGELGSMWGQLYPGAGNLGEALVTGQIAARSACTARQPATAGH
jgi:succinate dehydrogenase/fumarate reductase flavoprotein subunit